VLILCCTPQPSDHVDPGPIFENLPHLRDVSLVYKVGLPVASTHTRTHTHTHTHTHQVKDCGMGFKWSMFGMTSADAQMLGDALKYSSHLTRLTLHDSLVDDRKLRVVVTKLMGNATLEFLDLSHNIIGDKGARAVAKLIHGHSNIKELVLANNQIHGVGAQALGMALKGAESSLQALNLRLNRLETHGGKAFLEAVRAVCVCVCSLYFSSLALCTHTHTHTHTRTHTDEE
jgi:hypothetical protein